MAYEVKWPGWDVVDKIGAGSFGAVYRIRREMLGEEEFAALKVISIPQSSEELEELQSQGYDAATITTHFQKYLEDIIKEYSLMRRIKGNTNVVYCDDIQYVQKSDGFGWTIYIKMELLNPLMKNLHQVNSEAQVVKLAKDLCNALELCREQNIIHRDIKPQNVFISDHGSFKLGDFGIAKTVERTSRGTKIGTYKYMAPEVFHNRPYGHNADIYSLGMLLYWLLNEKRTPFLPAPPQIPTADMEDDAMMRRFRGDSVPAPAHGSPELAAVVLRACAADPAVRYQTAGEMLADLGKIVPSTAPFATVMPTPTLQNDHTIAAFAAPVNYAEETEGTVSIFGCAPVIPATSVAPAAPAASVTQAPAEPKEKKSKKGLLIVLLVALAAAIVVAGALLLPKLLSSGGPSETAPPANQVTDPTVAPSKPTDTPTDPTDEPTTPPSTEAPVVQVKIPYVTGMTRQQAIKTLEDLGLVVKIEYEHSQQADADTVLSQSVAADTEVQSGTTIVLVISMGSSTVSVPNVVGQLQETAEGALLAVGLKVSFQQEYSDSVSAGVVIRQSPVNVTCDIGTEVTLVVSLGKDTVQSIRVEKLPSHTCYLVGDVLDTAGLKIQAVYASGKTATITSGFNCSPMELNTAGNRSIAVSYNGLNTSFSVEVIGNVAYSGLCGKDVRWAIQKNGHFVAFGNGKMDSVAAGFAENTVPWAEYMNSITSVEIKDGVTSLLNCAFYECETLKTATMSDSVTDAIASTFWGCTNLESVKLSRNLKSIPSQMFLLCSSLKEITIPESVTKIGMVAFGSTGLTSIVIPEKVVSIGDLAFSGNKSLTSWTIKNPNCEFGSDILFSSGKQVVIHAPAGSTAQKYAEEKGLQFVVLP